MQPINMQHRICHLFCRSIRTVFCLVFLFLFSVFSCTTYAEVNKTEESLAVDLLNKMSYSMTHTDYQAYFFQQYKDSFPVTFEFSNLFIHKEQKNLAYLRYLEGPVSEVILHDNIVSYFPAERMAFSISSSRMVEILPNIIFSDFAQLADYYDFILVGKTRTADRSTLLVRIIAKNKDRHNYLIWIDEETTLPLRIDLLSLDYELIQLTKVVKLDLDFDKQAFQQSLSQRSYPNLLVFDENTDIPTDWELTWLPSGFKEINTFGMDFHESAMRSRFFSDGVFSFTVTLTEATDNTAVRIIEQSDKIILSANIDIDDVNHRNKNVVIIGNLPRQTIERIAQNIKLKTIQ